MNYFDRIKSRIEREGFLKTIDYLLNVGYFQLIDCICITWLDMRYSKRLLRGNLKTAYKNLGANDVYHTKYSVMPLIFNLLPIKKNDVLVDVGCGKGRVINYWLSRKLKNQIYGLELDKKIAKQTATQFDKRENVIIITGDAVSNIPISGTIFYFYNPFSTEKVEQFEERLSELFPNKPIKVVYYNPKSLSAFCNDRWNIKYINFEQDLGIKRWGRLNKYDDLAIITRKTSN